MERKTFRTGSGAKGQARLAEQSCFSGGGRRCAGTGHGLPAARKVIWFPHPSFCPCLGLWRLFWFFLPLSSLLMPTVSLTPGGFVSSSIPGSFLYPVSPTGEGSTSHKTQQEERGKECLKGVGEKKSASWWAWTGEGMRGREGHCCSPCSLWKVSGRENTGLLTHGVPITQMAEQQNEPVYPPTEADPGKSRGP